MGEMLSYVTLNQIGTSCFTCANDGFLQVIASFTFRILNVHSCSIALLQARHTVNALQKNSR